MYVRTRKNVNIKEKLPLSAIRTVEVPKKRAVEIREEAQI